MKKYERDGKTFWAWEPHEGEARRRFEAAMSCESVCDRAMEALLKAAQTVEASKFEAWRAWHEATGESDKNVYHYNWMSGEFRVAEEKR